MDEREAGKGRHTFNRVATRIVHGARKAKEPSKPDDHHRPGDPDLARDWRVLVDVVLPRGLSASTAYVLLLYNFAERAKVDSSIYDERGWELNLEA